MPARKKGQYGGYHAAITIFASSGYPAKTYGVQKGSAPEWRSAASHWMLAFDEVSGVQ
jgi:hypothetical protein